MKNLMIYISNQEIPFFDKEHARLIKSQIDNSLDLGWPAEKLLLITRIVVSAQVGDVIVEDSTVNQIHSNMVKEARGRAARR